MNWRDATVRISDRQLGVRDPWCRRGTMRWFSKGAHETPTGRSRILSNLAAKTWATEALLLEVRRVLTEATPPGQEVFNKDTLYNDHARTLAGVV